MMISQVLQKAKTALLPHNYSFFRNHSVNSFDKISKKSRELRALVKNGVASSYSTAETALSCIRSDQHVAVQMTTGSPSYLLRTLSQMVQDKQLQNVRLHLTLPLGNFNLQEAHLNQAIRSNCFFVGNDQRAPIAKGQADYSPITLSDLSSLHLHGYMHTDVALLQVSPPDVHGFVSMGSAVVYFAEVLASAKTLIGQVNKYVPRTFGDSTIHISHFDHLVQFDEPLPQVQAKKLTQEEKNIGKLISENLISDGSTLQLGIGAIPEAVTTFCEHYTDLGLHTEMLSDGAMNLIQKGVINNSQKHTDRGLSVTSFAVGSNSLYEFLNDNASIRFRSCGYTNDECVIRLNPKVTAINSCIELDLSGQAVSDMIGERIYSGFGGQLDFLRGSAKACDGQGKPILALNSITKNGESKIVDSLTAGSGVVSTRSHVYYVVTEYGIAQLFGKSLRQRAWELIRIAHPNFRESLEKSAFERLNCMPSKD